jgi:hypothetical protein
MSISIAMVALGDGARISAKAIRQDLAATWPDLPATSGIDGRSGDGRQRSHRGHRGRLTTECGIVTIWES